MGCDKQFDNSEICAKTEEPSLEERLDALEERIDKIELVNQVMRKVIHELSKDTMIDPQQEMYKKGLRFGR